MVEWCTQNLLRNGSISRGTSHATTTERYQYTTSVDINTRYKRIQSLIQNHMPMCAVSLLESKEQRYVKAMNNNNNNDINTRYKRIQSLIQNHMPMCAVSLLESKE